MRKLVKKYNDGGVANTEKDKNILDYSDSDKEKEVLFALEHNPFWLQETLSFEKLAPLVTEFINEYLIYGKGNPIITPHGDKIFFHPKESDIRIGGLKKSQIEYAAHFITGKVKVGSNVHRQYDSSKYEAMDLLLPTLTSIDTQRLFQKENNDPKNPRHEAIIYAREVSIGKTKNIIVVIEIKKDGLLNTFTYYPKRDKRHIQKQKASGDWSDAFYNRLTSGENPPSHRGEILAIGGDLRQNNYNKDNNNCSENKSKMNKILHTMHPFGSEPFTVELEDGLIRYEGKEYTLDELYQIYLSKDRYYEIMGDRADTTALNYERSESFDDDSREYWSEKYVDIEGVKPTDLSNSQLIEWVNDNFIMKKFQYFRKKKNNKNKKDKDMYKQGGAIVKKSTKNIKPIITLDSFDWELFVYQFDGKKALERSSWRHEDLGIRFESMSKLIDYISNNITHGYSHNSGFKTSGDGTIFTSLIVTHDNVPATDSEIEQYVNHKLGLFISEYYFHITINGKTPTFYELDRLLEDVQHSNDKLKKGGSTNKFDVNSLIGKGLFSKTSAGEIVSVKVISNDNVKVTRTLSFNSDSTIEKSYTMQELIDLSKGKKVDGEELITMEFANGGSTGASKIKNKVDEVNRLITLAFDKDGGPIDVIDTSGTWKAPMHYKPVVYSNGVLYIEYEEFGHNGFEIKKEKILKSNMELDGIPTLNDIAKMYRRALKENGIVYEEGGELGKDSQVLFKQSVNGINTITAEIEQTFNDTYSVMVYDEEGGLWLEKFEANIEDAKKTAEEMFNKAIKKYAKGGSMYSNGGYTEGITPEEFKEWAKERKIESIDELDGFHIGDSVVFKNEAEITFGPYTIVGIDKDDSFYNRRFYLNKDSYWFPVKSEEIKHYHGAMGNSRKVWEASIMMNPIVPSEIDNPRIIKRIFVLNDASTKSDVETIIKNEGSNIKEILSITEEKRTGGSIYSKGGSAKSDYWIQGSIEHKGSLRRKAKEMGLIKGDEKLSFSDLDKLEALGGIWAKRANEARNLMRISKKKKAS